MYPTNMILTKRGKTAVVTWENARVSTVIETTPKRLVQWAHQIIERFEPEVEE